MLDMVQTCKCTHDFPQHSYARFYHIIYKNKPCTICNCKDYVNQNNKIHIVYLINSIFLGLGFSAVCVALIIMFYTHPVTVNMDGFTSFPINDLIQHIFPLPFIAGVYKGIRYMMKGLIQEDLSNYRRQIKPL